ncbi:MAG: hypothetical protein ACLP4V_10515 [Methylocella sp.]
MTFAARATSHFEKTPPKPTLTLRVGISGHRPKPEVFPAENFTFVRRHLREVFAAISDDLTKIAGDQSAHYSDEAPKVRLVSALAEGADQMAVEEMPQEWTLDAILPFPEKIYEEDFKQSAIDSKTDITRYFRRWLYKAETILALPDDLRAQGRPLARDDAYARIGGFLLRQIDVLVAVWDGKPEQGRGGTAEVVRTALNADIPVVWIKADQDIDARMIESIERDGSIVAPEADCLKGPLKEAIETIIRLPEPDESKDCPQEGEKGPDAATHLQNFFGEKWPRPSLWLAYDLFKRWMEGKPLRWLIAPERREDYAPRWKPFAEDAPKVGPLGGRIEALLLERFAWADALALDYSHRYRATYIISYLLAAVAVGVALSGLVLHGGGKNPPFEPVAQAFHASLEIAVISIIIFLVWRGRRRQWKERWMEYRALAELLAHVHFLAYLGEHGRAHRLGNMEAAPSAWFLWYLRATIREIGLPTALLDGAYQRAVLSAVDKHVILEQEKWHRGNARTLQDMSEALHYLGGLCFIGTLATLFLYLCVCAVYAIDLPFFSERLFGYDLRAYLPRLEDIVIAIAAFLPALGAALAGIRETGDFGKVAERSAKTATALKELHQEVARAKRELALDETGDVLLSTAQVLTEDLATWQSVYGHKRLELPA